MYETNGRETLALNVRLSFRVRCQFKLKFHFISVQYRVKLGILFFIAEKKNNSKLLLFRGKKNCIEIGVP